MKGDSSNAKPGMAVTYHHGETVVILGTRKTGSDAAPLPGWWLISHRSVGRSGLADRVLDSDDFMLLTPERIKRLWDADR